MVSPASNLDVVATSCPVLHECGGCPWMDRAAEVQWADKLGLLSEALGRAGLDFPEPSMTRAGTHLGYRNRLRLRVDEQGAAVFFNPNKLASCAVLDPRLSYAVAILQGLGPLRGLTEARHLELRVGDSGQVGLCVYGDTTLSGAAREALRVALPDAWQIGFAGDGSLPTLQYYLEEPSDAALSYAVPLSSFVQVNSAVNRALVSRVRELVCGAALTSFNDLFCGAGNFSLPLLADGLDGESIELDPLAIAALVSGARRWTGRAHRARVADARAVVEALEPRQLLLANPPRAGLKLDQATVRVLASCATHAVALCSCSPKSLARDLSALLPCGFELAELHAFDMFPHTEHLETLAWLRRV